MEVCPVSGVAASPSNGRLDSALCRVESSVCLARKTLRSLAEDLGITTENPPKVMAQTTSSTGRRFVPASA